MRPLEWPLDENSGSSRLRLRLWNPEPDSAISPNVHHHGRGEPSTDLVRDISPTRGRAGRSWAQSGSTRGAV